MLGGMRETVFARKWGASRTEVCVDLLTYLFYYFFITSILSRGLGISVNIKFTILPR